MTVPSAVASMARAMGATRGDVRRFDAAFGHTMIPMVLIDHALVTVDVNRPARLFARHSLSELVGRPLNDYYPPDEAARLRAVVDRLLRDGEASGVYDIRLPDGSSRRVVYAALMNVLPDRHLLVFQPADWPEDELDGVDLEGVSEPLDGPLTTRELEVLTLVAAGQDLQRIADELTISRFTVRTHVRNALRKLHAHNRPHGVAVAMHLGLIDLPPQRLTKPEVP